jgi:hypothetical protein
MISKSRCNLNDIPNTLDKRLILGTEANKIIKMDVHFITHAKAFDSVAFQKVKAGNRKYFTDTKVYKYHFYCSDKMKSFKIEENTAYK